VSGLRVTRLALQDVGVIRGRVDLGAFDPEITLITGANETGKSTAVEALRCALFEKHNAGHAGIKGLQPHGTPLAPQVWVEFEYRSRRYALHKRFLRQPLAELRIDDTEVLVGPDADQGVWDLLGAAAPGRQGHKDNRNIGIWGLLWVSQDEAAAADPGTKIGEETRGALQDVIGRQVGQIVGGRHGERIRARAREEARRFWTPTLAQASGELAEARGRHERATARVETIQAAIRDVEGEGVRVRSLQVEIDELLSIRPALEREVAGAVERAARVDALSRAAEGARERLATAEARRDEAETARNARRELVASLASAEERLAATVVELEELAIVRDAKSAEAASAAKERDTAVSAAQAADRARDDAERALEQGRGAREAADLADRLERAEGLEQELETLEERERTALDDARYQHLVQHGERRRELAARLEGESPGNGLTGTTSADALEAARELRRERIQLEVRLDETTEALAEQAPDGVEALAEAAASGRTTLGRDEAGLEGALAAAAKLEDLRKELAANPMDEAALERVSGRAQRLEVARARSEAIGTAVEVTALDDLAVARGGDEPTPLSRGESVAWSLDQPTRLRLGEFAELSITPGGDEVAEAGARLDTAEASLAELLDELGVDDLEAARERGAAWAALRERVRAAEVALSEQAPAGIDALGAAVEEARATQTILDRRLGSARQLAEQRAQVEATLVANPMTGSVMTHLEELARVDDELRRALADAGVDSQDEAAARWKAGLTVAAQIAGARSSLAELAPAGVEALRSASAAAADGGGAEDPVDIDALETRLAEARGSAVEARKEAERARDAADVAEAGRSTCVTEIAKREGARDNTLGGVDRERTRLETARDGQPDEDLETRRTQLAAVLDEAQVALRAAEEALETASPELIEGDAERAEETLGESHARQKRLETELTRVKARLEVAAAEGRFEQLGEAQAELDSAADDLARVERAAAGARRLVEEVDRAYAEAQRRFLAPVVKEARPYLSAIRPDTDIRMTEDLTVAKVLRRGVEEDFDQLSGGTREQLSVIVRLALARVLARDEDAEPLPLILDDTMGWTDEPRFVEMVRILRNASKQFQLIVLTCHPSRFARLQPGRTIELDTLRREAAQRGDPDE